MAANFEKTIRALEERLWKAQLSSDVSVLDELIADDLLFTGISGALETKAGDLEQHRSGVLKITKLTPLDFKTREIPNGAITSVKMSCAATIHGKEAVAVLRYTRVWILRNNRWQIVGGHMSVAQD